MLKIVYLKNGGRSFRQHFKLLSSMLFLYFVRPWMNGQTSAVSLSACSFPIIFINISIFISASSCYETKRYCHVMAKMLSLGYIFDASPPLHHFSCFFITWARKQMMYKYKSVIFSMFLHFISEWLAFRFFVVFVCSCFCLPFNKKFWFY